MAMYRKSFEDLQVDTIDYYLLHSIGNGGIETFRQRYIENGMIDFLMKERGKNKNGRNPECVRSGRGDGNHGAGPYVLKNFPVDLSSTFCYYLYQNIFEIESEASFC